MEKILKKKKILIGYLPAGMGHGSAARALGEAFELKYKDKVDVKVFNGLDYSNRFLKNFYSKGYIFFADHLPKLYGFLYRKTDSNTLLNRIIIKIRNLFDRSQVQNLKKFFQKEKPSAIIGFHIADVVSHWLQEGKIDCFFATVITDFIPHFWLVNKQVDRCYVANRESKDIMHKFGLPYGKLKVAGIPINPVFTKKKDKKILRERFGLERDLFTVLVLGGSFFEKKLRKIVENIIYLKEKIQVIVVVVSNEKVRSEIEELSKKTLMPIKVFGYTKKINDLMDVSDIIISKTGGLICSEALSKNLPMIIINPLPGNEEDNAEYLLKHGAALRAFKLEDIGKIVSDILYDPEELYRLKHNIKKIAKPNAAFDIAEDIMNLLSQ